ncbi:MAG: right-handed parallel beta-helix repeat-containing protein [Thermodesulfobacteriota bacterium]
MNHRGVKREIGRLIFISVVVCACLLIDGPARAATYYCRSGPGSGGTGTQADPFVTLHYAMDQLAANDVLILEAGTYSNGNGEPSANLSVPYDGITIKGPAVGTALLEGASGGTWSTGLLVNGKNNVIIENLEMRHFQSEAVYIVSSNNCQVKGCTIYDNGSVGRGIELQGGSGNQISDNEIYWTGDGTYVQEKGIYVLSGADSSNKILRNNIHGHNDVGAYGIYVSGSGPDIAENYLYGNFYGVYLNYSTSSVLRNKLKDHQYAVYIYAVTEVSNVINNLIYTPLAFGISVTQASAGSVSPGLYHNTISGASQFGIDVYNSGAEPLIYYNIVVNSNFGIGSTNAQLGGVPTLRYNDVFGNTADYYWVAPGVGDISFDPLFVNSAAEDFHLDAASQCIDAIPAAESDPITEDFDKKYRPYPVNGASDMGCYEYSPPESYQTYDLVFAPGTTTAQYVSRSIPFVLQDPRPTAAFGPYIGAYDPARMRIGYWCGELQAYREYPGGDQAINPGDAAWFLFRDGQTITLKGTPVTTAPDPLFEQPSFRIPLGQGWNQIGNCFLHPVAIADMVAADMSLAVKESFTSATLTQGIFWVWAGGSYQAAAKLPTAGGGWVKAFVPGYLYIRDAAVAYPDLAPDRDTVAVPDSVERPPSPPADINASTTGAFSSGGGGGGGGGGCFIDSSLAD